MGANSKIEWTDHTFNPWVGCTKVHEGCAHCYAERNTYVRFQGVKWGDQGERKVMSDDYWKNPLEWDRQARNAGRRARVFCASLSDVFEDRPELRLPRARLLHTILNTPSLDWLCLTKRPEKGVEFLRQWADLHGESDQPQLARGPQAVRAVHPSGRGQLWADYVESLGPPPQGAAYPTFDWMEGWRWMGPRIDNLWLGTSVSLQPHADNQVPPLLKARELCAGLFLSIEPMLGRIDVSPWLGEGGIDWVIAGGESGPKARPCHPDWIGHLRNDCVRADVPFFFKQWGEWAPSFDWQNQFKDVPDSTPVTHLAFDGHRGQSIAQMEGHPNHGLMVRIGKKLAGATYAGREWRQTPFQVEANA